MLLNGVEKQFVKLKNKHLCSAEQFSKVNVMRDLAVSVINANLFIMMDPNNGAFVCQLFVNIPIFFW